MYGHTNVKFPYAISSSLLSLPLGSNYYSFGIS